LRIFCANSHYEVNFIGLHGKMELIKQETDCHVATLLAMTGDVTDCHAALAMTEMAADAMKGKSLSFRTSPQTGVLIRNVI